mgnify:CR=1 FL=1
MAQRRMFSMKIVDTDAFLDMSQTAQLLYFHFSMRADDDGFVSNPKKIMRMIGVQDDDMKVLIAKKFIIPFESGVCVIKHWKIHNYIQNDRYTETNYTDEKKKLLLKENGSYKLKDEECIQDVSKVDTQVRLGKVSIGEEREKETSPDKPESSLSWLGTFNEKEEFTCGVPGETLKAFAEKYRVSEDQIRNKCEDLVLWAKTTKKVKKNYKTFLQVILKKDFGIRTPEDKVLLERIELTKNARGQSSSFAKSLASKMKM